MRRRLGSENSPITISPEEFPELQRGLRFELKYNLSMTVRAKDMEPWNHGNDNDDVVDESIMVMLEIDNAPQIWRHSSDLFSVS